MTNGEPDDQDRSTMKRTHPILHRSFNRQVLARACACARARTHTVMQSFTASLFDLTRRWAAPNDCDRLVVFWPLSNVFILLLDRLAASIHPCVRNASGLLIASVVIGHCFSATLRRRQFPMPATCRDDRNQAGFITRLWIWNNSRCLFVGNYNSGKLRGTCLRNKWCPYFLCVTPVTGMYNNGSSNVDATACNNGLRLNVTVRTADCFQKLNNSRSQYTTKCGEHGQCIARRFYDVRKLDCQRIKSQKCVAAKKKTNELESFLFHWHLPLHWLDNPQN